MAGAFLRAAQELLAKGMHPTQVSDGFQVAMNKSVAVIESMATPVDLNNRDQLIQNAITSLSSKVVSHHSDLLAPIAVDAILKIIDKETATNCDLNNIHVSKCIGGTIDDSELIDGLVFVGHKASHFAGGPTRIENAKIGLLQFPLSAPKTDLESNVVVHDYTAMDRLLKEEKKYILDLVKKIIASGANVLLLQKSVLREAASDLALHFLAKKKIMVVRDIDRDQIDFISRTTGAIPVAHIDQFTSEKCGKANLVVEESAGGESRMIKILGCPNQGKTVSILLRGSNGLVLEEADRSLHDALCVVRALVKKRSLVPGGACVEMEVAHQLQVYSREIFGSDSYVCRAYGEALELIPYTLSENAGFNPIVFVTELRNRHNDGEIYSGLNIKKSCIEDMSKTQVV
jgi:T-complex protein 1 subunit delta